MNRLSNTREYHSRFQTGTCANAVSIPVPDTGIFINHKFLFMKTKLPVPGIRVIVWMLFALLLGGNSFGQITQRGTATTATSTATSITINKPSGVLPGDILLVNITQTDNDGNNLSNASASGWTVIDGRLIYDAGSESWWGTVLYRVVTGSEGTNFTFTLDGDATEGNTAAMVAFYNVNTTAGVTETGAAGGPFDVDPGTINVAGGASTNVSITGISNATAGAGIVMFVNLADDNTLNNNWNTTSPGALAELADNPFNSTTDPGVGIGFAVKSTIGATGNGTVTQSGSDRYGGMMIALKPCVAPTITGTLSVCIGATTQLTGAGTPAVSNPWLSASTGVATVDDNGLVTGVTAGTSVITYTNNLGCLNRVTVTVNANPTITLGASPSACAGSTSASLTYSATTGSPNQYSIDYDAAAEAEGFVDVVNAALPASPIVMVVPAGATPGFAYNGTITVRNSTTGCVSAGQVRSVTVNPVPTVSTGTNPEVCRGITSALLSYSTTNSPNQYSIDYDAAANAAGFVDVVNATLSGGNITLVIPGAAAGTVTYNGTLTVRNSVTGCVSSAQPIEVTVLAPTVSFTGPSTICIGSSTTLSPTSGGTWVSNNPSVATVDDEGNVTTVSPGTSTFTFTETGTGCSNTTGTLTVNGNSTISLTSAPATTAQTVCISTAITNIVYQVGGGGTGVTVTGLPGGVTFNYVSGTKVATISGSPNASGTFNYTITTTGPCVNTSLTGTISVTANATMSLTSGNNVQAVCAGTAIATITYNVGGSATGATASGLPAGINGVYDAGVFTISGNSTAAGVYNYTVTTTGPCVNPNMTGTITVNALPVVTIGASPATVCIGSTSTLTATNSGGNPNLVFSGSNSTSTAIPDWSASAYTYSSISLSAGSNTLAATDLLQVTINITHNNDDHLDIFLVDPSGTRAMLLSSDNGGSGNNYTNTVLSTSAANVIGSGGNNTAPFTGTYRPEGTISTAPDRAGAAFGGNYNAVIPASALNGASINGSWTLRVFDDGFGTTGTLTGWTLTITKPGAYVTVFNGPGSFGSVVPGGGATNTAPTVVVTPPAGVNSYTATTTDAIGCQGTTVVPVDVTVNPDATITLVTANNNQAACFNAPTPIADIVYNIGGGGTGAGAINLPPGVTGSYNAGVFTISGTPNAPGTYNYTVTTTGTCTQASAGGTIVVNTPPNATFTRTNVSACNAVPDGTISINATGGTGPYNYAWSGMTGIGATVPYANPGNVSAVSDLNIGYYNVTVTDAVGCQASINGMHVQYAFSAFVTNNGSISSSCANTGSIILYANAGVQPYTFSLDGVNYTSNNTFLNLAAATYTAYVKDGAGCVITKSITIGAAAPVVALPFMRPASSCSNDGVIEIYRSGGISPYTYSMDGVNYQSSHIYNNLPAGAYTVYVKDSKGCVASANVTVTQGAALNVTTVKTEASTCQNDGTIRVNVGGGFAPYTYSINGGAFQSSNSFLGLAAGSYAVTVKDFKGCEGTANVTINLNTISVTSFVTAASNCASTNGSIHLFRTGGVGPYTYSLDGNNYQASSMFTNLAPGIYDGYVKDSKTCIGIMYSIEVLPNDCNPPVAGNAKGIPAANTELSLSENSVLKIGAYPNPSVAQFNLSLEGNSNENVFITVTDMLGRKMYQATGNIKQPYRFGSDFKAGIYMLQVVQGTAKQTIKLVKE